MTHGDVMKLEQNKKGQQREEIKKKELTRNERKKETWECGDHVDTTWTPQRKLRSTSTKPHMRNHFAFSSSRRSQAARHSASVVLLKQRNLVGVK